MNIGLWMEAVEHAANRVGVQLRAEQLAAMAVALKDGVGDLAMQRDPPPRGPGADPEASVRHRLADALDDAVAEARRWREVVGRRMGIHESDTLALEALRIEDGDLTWAGSKVRGSLRR